MSKMPPRFDLVTGYARNDDSGLSAILASASAAGHMAPVAFSERFFTYAAQPAALRELKPIVLPTASNAIEMGAQFWAGEGIHRVGVINPAGDFIHDMLKDAGLATSRIDEIALFKNPARALNNIDALYLIVPNNPTGTYPDEREFRALLAEAKKRDLPVMVDFCFRFYGPLHEWDQYKALMESGVRFIGIEDTGKSFPAQGHKAGFLVSNPDDYKALKSIARNTLPDRGSLAMVAEVIARAGKTPESLPMRAAAERNRALLVNSGLFKVSPGGAAPFAEISIDGWPASWQRQAMDNAGISLMSLKAFYGSDSPKTGLQVPLAFAGPMFDRFIVHARDVKASVEAEIMDVHRQFVKRF